MDINATISQLTAERDKLDNAIQALQTLENSSAPASRATARPARRGRRTRTTNGTRTNGTRTNGTTANGTTTNGTTAHRAAARDKVLTPEKVVGLLNADGVPASEIRQQTGGSADGVLRVLKQLESDGTVKRTGERRSTRWHLTSN
jgi:predicted Rossmann fold nucleotide-binding protein DprA/Smf involved in DNA uptake